MLDDLQQELAAFRQQGLKLEFSYTQLALLSVGIAVGLYLALIAAHYTTK